MSEQVNEIRNAVYGDKGFYVSKSFINNDIANAIAEGWTHNVKYWFSDFIPNKEVEPGTPPYAYFRPGEDDFAYCSHIWNDPIDERMHEIAYQAQILRNKIEGQPIYYGLHEAHGRALQYRVCRTVSSGVVVKKHADFFNEFRHDPTGNHDFDPSRLQLTLMLSTYGKDYVNGGFKLFNKDNGHTLFGRDIEITPGDLIIWRYSISHEVSDVEALNYDYGFLRVIFPLYDTKMRDLYESA